MKNDFTLCSPSSDKAHVPAALIELAYWTDCYDSQRIRDQGMDRTYTCIDRFQVQSNQWKWTIRLNNCTDPQSIRGPEFSVPYEMVRPPIKDRRSADPWSLDYLISPWVPAKFPLWFSDYFLQKSIKKIFEKVMSNVRGDRLSERWLII